MLRILSSINLTAMKDVYKPFSGSYDNEIETLSQNRRESEQLGADKFL
jgi:hypothetical protein